MNLQEQKFLISTLYRELKVFHKIEPLKFYADLITTGLTLWISLYALSVTSNLLLGFIFFILIYTTMYRGAALIHEVIHFKNKVRGLETLYNILIGFPLRVPAYIHTPHQYHHNPTTFGTENDPEYLYLKGKGGKYFYEPILKGIFTPLLLVLRFGIYPLIAAVMPKKVRIVIYQRLSTIVVNPAYIRPIKNEQELKIAFRQDLGCGITFALMLTLFAMGVLNIKFFLIGYLFSSITAIVNIYRARIGHLYDNHTNEALDPLSSLRDSVNVSGGPLSFFWAPIGLRYHALHHLAPQIPHYNLGKAHRHLLSKIEENHPYAKTVVPNLTTGLLNYKNLLEA